MHIEIYAKELLYNETIKLLATSLFQDWPAILYENIAYKILMPFFKGLYMFYLTVIQQHHLDLYKEYMKICTCSLD